MPFSRPTYSEIVARIESDMSTRMLNGAPVKRFSMLGIIARVVAGVSHMLHGYIQWCSKQILVTTCDPEYIDKHSEMYNITRKPANHSIGIVVFFGEIGATIPNNSIISKSDGVQYKTSSEAIISSDGFIAVSFTAVEPGLLSNCLPGTIVQLSSPIAGVNTSAMVTSGGATGGSGVESDGELAARVLERLRLPPHGGAAHDYITWCKEAQTSVYRAFVFSCYDQPNHVEKPGYVAVSFVNKDVDNPFPNDEQRGIVETYISTKKPTAATVTVFTPQHHYILVSAAIKVVKGQVFADVLERVKYNIKKLLLDTGTPDAIIYKSKIFEAIVSAAGVDICTLNSPVGDISISKEEFPMFDNTNSIFTEIPNN